MPVKKKRPTKNPKKRAGKRKSKKKQVNKTEAAAGPMDAGDEMPEGPSFTSQKSEEARGEEQGREGGAAPPGGPELKTHKHDPPPTLPPVDPVLQECLKLASGLVFVQSATEDPEQEEIYADELEDGLSDNAQEAARVWAEAVKDGEVLDGIDAKFIEEIQSLFQSSKGKKGKAMQDQAASHAGVFSSSMRLQPRFESGAAAKFDNLVKVKTALELKAIRSKDGHKLRPAFQSQILPDVPKPPVIDSPFAPVKGGAWETYLAGQAGSVLDDAEDCPCLVIDNDTMMCAGFGGDDAPRAVFPAIVGRPRHKGVMVGMGQKDAYVGDEAQSKRGILTMKYPLGHQGVENWDDMEKIWHHTFYNELRVAPEEHPVCITEDAVNSLAARQKLCQIMFETFNVPALLLISRPQLAIVSTGSLTGINVSLCDRFCEVSAVHAGTLLHTLRLEVGSRTLTDQLMKILTERGYSFTTTAEREIVRDMREKLAFTAVSFQKQLSDAVKERTYELPDGQSISIGNEAFRCVEPLFEPALCGVESPGLDLLVASAIFQCDENLRASLYGNIALSGDCATVKGLEERLAVDLEASAPRGVKVKVVSVGKYGTWIGGSILSSLSSVAGYFITKEQYDASGPTVVKHQTGAMPQLASFSVPVPMTAAERAAAEERTRLSEQERVRAEEEQKVKIAAEQAELARKQQEAQVALQQKREKEARDKEAARIASQMIHPIPTPNVVHLPMASLQTRIEPHKGAPVRCEQCEAYLTWESVVSEDFAWVCELCEHTNMVVLEEGQRPTGPVFEIVNVPATSKEVGVMAGGSGNSLVIFCIDASGSMGEGVPFQGKLEFPEAIVPKWQASVTRMDCMKAAVYEQLRVMKDHFPNQRPVLLVFSSGVTVIFGDGTPPFELDENGNVEFLMSLGREMATGHLLPAAEGAECLMTAVSKIRHSGMTALGPSVGVALGIAESIAATSQGSKIIVMTDGQANRGVGSLQNKKQAQADYLELAQQATSIGAQVSVLSIQGTKCDMDTIGQLAERTGGQMDVVDPLALNKLFSRLVSQSILGTAVSIKLALNPAFACKTNVGDQPSATALWECGNVNANTDFAVYVEAGKGQTPATLQAQVTIRYSRADGATLTRVISRVAPCSHNRDHCEGLLDSAVAAMKAIQHAAELGQNGSYQDARIHLLSTQRLLQRAMNTKAQQRAYINFIKQGERLDGFMRIAQHQASLLGDGRVAQRDDTAARNILQMKNCPHVLMTAL